MLPIPIMFSQIYECPPLLLPQLLDSSALPPKMDLSEYEDPLYDNATEEGVYDNDFIQGAAKKTAAQDDNEEDEELYDTMYDTME